MKVKRRTRAKFRMAHPAATWTDADESALLAFLLDHKAEAGDGANFKQTTWNEAAIKLGERPYKGGAKTANSCKNKWAKVSGNAKSHSSHRLTGIFIAQGDFPCCQGSYGTIRLLM